MNNFLDRWFNKREIKDCDGSTYMHRWFVIRKEAFAEFIHKFVRSDFERAIHDHPWDFIVIPIWRGYIEHSEDKNGNPTKRRVYPILGTRFRRAEFRHRVELFTRTTYYVSWMSGFPESIRVDDPLPAWSIFIRFRKRRPWGFWFPTGWQEAKEWWQQHCADTPEMEASGKPGEVKSN